MSRGIKRRSSMPGTMRFDGVTHDGCVAFELTVSDDAFREELIRDLERYLDAIDPPLLLVRGSAQSATAVAHHLAPGSHCAPPALVLHQSPATRS